MTGHPALHLLFQLLHQLPSNPEISGNRRFFCLKSFLIIEISPEPFQFNPVEAELRNIFIRNNLSPEHSRKLSKRSNLSTSWEELSLSPPMRCSNPLINNPDFEDWN